MLTHIQEIIDHISNSHGNEFFTKLTLALNKAITADYIFIARINLQADSYKTQALVANGKISDNIESPLNNSPCVNISANTVCFHSKNVAKLFPEDPLLIKLKIQAYLAVPLVNTKQNVFGLLVALFKAEHKNEVEAVALLQLFSGRIAAELEHLDYEKLLEQRMSIQTQELAKTAKELKLTQQQLIESEKMSALGNLVAGVSHEVNTPLGIAITTHSIMADELKKLKDKLDSNSLSMKDMENFRNNSDSALTMQGENLNRAKKLIENFKKTAADQNQLEIETVDIGQYYQKVISTLRSMLKPENVTLEINCQDTIMLATYPGVHAQILTNLINNSVKHGFASSKEASTDTDNISQENKIIIEIKLLATDEVEVIYSDNGRGLSKEAQQHVFEPFFTTARNQGGIGLGMSIVFNLINQKINGSIEATNLNSGACFHYNFKSNSSN